MSLYRVANLAFLAVLVLPVLTLARAEEAETPAGVALDLGGVPRLEMRRPAKTLHPVYHRGEGRKVGWIVRLPTPGTDQAPGDRPVPSASVVGGRVLVGGGSQSARLFALDAITGRKSYSVDLDEAAVSMVASGTDRIVTCTESCTTYGIETATGKRIWSLWLGPSIMASPTIDGTLAVMGYRKKDDSYALTALDTRDGRVRWDTPIDRDIVGAPVAALGRIFITTQSRTALCLDREGRVLWRKENGATSAPWLGGGGLYYAATARGRPDVIRVDPLDGKIVWTTDAPTRTGPANQTGTRAALVAPARGGWGDDPPRPVVLDPYVVLADGRELMVYDSETGSLARRFILPEGRSFHAPPAVLGSRLLFATLEGLLLEIDPGSGAIRRALDLGVRVTSQPVVAKGRVYVTAGSTIACIPWSGPDWPEWGGGPSRTGRR